MSTDDRAAPWHIRAGRDSDGPPLIGLIWACWSAYPGIRMYVDLEMPELHALATYYNSCGGALWIAEIDSTISGMIAVRPLFGAAWEICRVYVDPALHGSGLGHALLDVAEHHAIAAGAEKLMLWSDTRFDRAHRFYEKRSYVRHGAVRVLNDISNSLEFGYAKPVNGISVLDIAGAEAAVGRLVAILNACVASASFTQPFPPTFWRDMVRDVGAGRRIIVAAWRDGVLVGTGMLDLAVPENQRHRCEVAMLLVHPSARRNGLGRQILRALQEAAAAKGRSLVTVRTYAGDAAEKLFRNDGWQEAGRIPGFAHDAGGMAHAAVLFWKQIAGTSTDHQPVA